jgi:hypothetical protein
MHVRTSQDCKVVKCKVAVPLTGESCERQHGRRMDAEWTQNVQGINRLCCGAHQVPCPARIPGIILAASS